MSSFLDKFKEDYCPDFDVEDKSVESRDDMSVCSANVESVETERLESIYFNDKIHMKSLNKMKSLSAIPKLDIYGVKQKRKVEKKFGKNERKNKRKLNEFLNVD